MQAVPLERPVENQRRRVCQNARRTREQPFCRLPGCNMDHVAAEYRFGGLNWPIGVACIQEDRRADARTIGLACVGVDIRKGVDACFAWLPFQAEGKTGCDKGRVLAATACDLEQHSRGRQYVLQYSE